MCVVAVLVSFDNIRDDMARTDGLIANIVNVINTILCYLLVLTKNAGQGKQNEIDFLM